VYDVLLRARMEIDHYITGEVVKEFPLLML